MHPFPVLTFDFYIYFHYTMLPCLPWTKKKANETVSSVGHGPKPWK